MKVDKKSDSLHLDKATSYAKRGWPVLPMYWVQDGLCNCAKGHGCSSPGKHPLTSHGVNDASSDPKKLFEWWIQNPTANIGIATGKKSGLLILDIDPRNDGDITLTRLEAQLGDLPETAEVATGGGGRHLYFKYPPFKVKKDSAGKVFGPGVDVLSDGCIAVAPPSIHKSGKTYRWPKGHGIFSREIQPLPDAWLKHFRTYMSGHLEDKIAPKSSTPKSDADSYSLIPEGNRNTALTSLAGKIRQTGLDREGAMAALHRTNTTRCKPPLPKEDIDKIVNSVWHYELRPHQAGDLAEEISELVLKQHFGGGCHLIFAGDGQFWEFNRTHWHTCSSHSLQRRILATVKSIGPRKGQTTAIVVGQVSNILKAQQSVDDARLLTVSDPPAIFNCANGEVQVSKDGEVELFPHRPESYLTSCSSIVYDATATCPLFDAALDSTFQESAKPLSMRRHWYEFMGYTIFPMRNIAVIVILFGSGENGKTTLMQTLIRLIGQDRVAASRVEELESNRFMMGSLLGKLLFFDDDVRAGARLPDGSLKKISEVKVITGEHKFGKPFQFTCRTVPVLACNNTLSLADVSNGMRRRLMVVPFDHRFTEADLDKSLFVKIWASEMPGILNKAIKGLKRIITRREQFSFPQAVKDATTNWVNQSNPLPAFVEECCQVDASHGSYVADLYASYVDWAKANGYTMQQQSPAFVRNLNHIGFPKASRGSRGARVSGLRLVLG